ncbi:hypothetical protein TNCV_3438901 [Trichonephila clavipes]|nr:hypothetical protein TNCV_3438901 [Trichonephila clavipes]
MKNAGKPEKERRKYRCLYAVRANQMRPILGSTYTISREDNRFGVIDKVLGFTEWKVPGSNLSNIGDPLTETSCGDDRFGMIDKVPAFGMEGAGFESFPQDLHSQSKTVSCSPIVVYLEMKLQINCKKKGVRSIRQRLRSYVVEFYKD